MNKTKIIIQSIIKLIVFIGGVYCIAMLYRYMTLDNVTTFKVVCMNDGELLISQPGLENVIHRKFCPTCGKPTEKVGVMSPDYCPECDVTVGENDQYCSLCGNKKEKTSLHNWLEMKQYCTTEKYLETIETAKEKNTNKCLAYAFVYMGFFVLYINAESIADMFCRKKKKK